MSLSVFSRNFSIEAGIYDFTDKTQKAIFSIAPSFLLSIDVYERTKLSINIATGASFASSGDYYSETYQYIIIPVNITIQYKLIDVPSRFFPYVGGGFSINGLIDRNPFYSDDMFDLTYGYLAMAGVCINIGNLILSGNMKYNILIPSKYVESPNPEGIITTIGLRIPIGKNKKTKEQ